MGDVIAQAFASSGDQVNGSLHLCDRSNRATIGSLVAM